MPNNERRIDWVVLITSVIASTGTCLAGLGILIRLILAPIITDIENIKSDVEDNKKITESIHAISTNVAVLTNDIAHIKNNLDKNKEN